MKHYVKSVFLCLLFNALMVPAFGQKIVPPLPQDTLAMVGTSAITARDLIERIEFMPWQDKEKARRYDSSKVKALQSLVAERLLSFEGSQTASIAGDELLKLKTTAMEKMFVRDELYRREIKANISLSDAEISEGLKRFAWELHLVAVGVWDREAGDSLCKRLKRNDDIISAVRQLPYRSVTAFDTVKVNFGGLDTTFERQAYTLGNSKKISPPFLSPSYGWVVAVLLERTANPIYDKMNWGDRRYRVEETIRRQKEIERAKAYSAGTLFQQKAKADSTVFADLARELRKLLMQDSAAHKRNGLFAINSDDVDQLLALFRNRLSAPFIVMEHHPLPLGEAIEALRTSGFGFTSLEPSPFQIRLNAGVRMIIEQEIMSREGYRRQLQQSKSVRHDMEIWTRYWASRHYMWNLNDTVRVSETDQLDAMRQAIRDLGPLYLVNVQEILCPDIPAAGALLDSLASGTSFDALARRNSLRHEWAASGGISGFFPLSKNPELGARAMMADVGITIGPIRLSEGYSIFKLLGRKRISFDQDSLKRKDIMQLAMQYPDIGTAVRLNIQEALCGSAAEAQRCLDSLRNGAAFSALARHSTMRRAWSERGGVSGFFAVSEHPALGRAAMLADTGKLVGPIKLPEGYSVFKVLGKKWPDLSEFPSADSLRVAARANVLTAKRQSSLDSYIASTAKKYGVQFFYEKLPGIEIQSANMVTRRRIGFGGTIAAYPLLYPNYRWVSKMNESQRVIP
ncbi:MAG: peptidylprolyl isomerase [Ignavibacteriales bacterium]|nr:peptidylprolyl isomerase [Ignavibacteriales bacterium]